MWHQSHANCDSSCALIRMPAQHTFSLSMEFRLFLPSKTMVSSGQMVLQLVGEHRTLSLACTGSLLMYRSNIHTRHWSPALDLHIILTRLFPIVVVPSLLLACFWKGFSCRDCPLTPYTLTPTLIITPHIIRYMPRVDLLLMLHIPVT